MKKDNLTNLVKIFILKNQKLKDSNHLNLNSLKLLEIPRGHKNQIEKGS